MAVLFDVYDNAGGQTFSASGGAINLNLDTTREEEPSGSGSPWSLSSDEVTYNDDGVIVLHYSVTVGCSSTTSTTVSDGFYCVLQVDTGGGFAAIDGTIRYGHPDTGTAGAGACVAAACARDHASGDKYRIRLWGVGANTTWITVADGSNLCITDDQSGGGSGAPTDASYIVAAADGTLTDERVATSGEGVAVVNSASGGTATFDLNVPGLSAFTSPLSTDLLCLYDDTAKEHKKVTVANLSRVQHASSVATAAVNGAGGGAMLAICLSSHIAGMAESAFAGTVIADALTALNDFRDNGSWHNLRAPDADAVRRAIKALTIHQNWDGSTG